MYPMYYLLHFNHIGGVPDASLSGLWIALGRRFGVSVKSFGSVLWF